MNNEIALYYARKRMEELEKDDMEGLRQAVIEKMKSLEPHHAEWWNALRWVLEQTEKNMNNPIKIRNMKMLVKVAHEKIEGALPEDEPDCVPDWVCELLIQFGYEFGLAVAIAKQLNSQDKGRT